MVVASVANVLAFLEKLVALVSALLLAARGVYGTRLLRMYRPRGGLAEAVDVDVERRNNRSEGSGTN